MIFPVPESVLLSQVALTQQRFALMLSNPEAFASILEKGLTFQGSENSDHKAKLAKQGFFSVEMLQAMISGGEEYRMEAIDFIWTRLLDAKLAVKVFAHMPRAFADHIINRHALGVQLRDDTFTNLFRPPSALITRYAGSVLAIDVLKSGTDMRGSGFILLVGNRPMIVTCKHNVDPAEDVTVTSVSDADGTQIPVPQFAVHDLFDLAVAPLESFSSSPSFRAGINSSVFDETFTVGYPNVPQAISGLVGHRGEINGSAELYSSKCPIILISNLVSPGSSGCPVLLRDGHCAGMTIQWLEAEYGQGLARFSAAIPVSQIEAFARAVLSPDKVDDGRGF